MTVTHSKAECSNNVSYLLGLLNEEERGRFEEHLKTCENCRLEIEQLQPVIQTMPHAIELVQPPISLKHKVLQSAFQVKAPADKRGTDVRRTVQTVRPITSWQQFWSNVYGKLSLGLISVLTFAMGASFWYMQNLPASPGSQVQPASSMNVERSFALYPTADFPQGTGTAYLVHTASGMQIVVQVENVKQLADDQAYQVWLLKNGQRQSAGTFLVNEKGSGILIYSFGSQKPDFDSIGITREPDPFGTSPRGPKVLGSRLL